MPGWANCISGAACRRFIELFHQVLLVLWVPPKSTINC
jgi:hypothetical protein